MSDRHWQMNGSNYRGQTPEPLQAAQLIALPSGWGSLARYTKWLAMVETEVTLLLITYKQESFCNCNCNTTCHYISRLLYDRIWYAVF
jgi:hypothetical protein